MKSLTVLCCSVLLGFVNCANSAEIDPPGIQRQTFIRFLLTGQATSAQSTLAGIQDADTVYIVAIGLGSLDLEVQSLTGNPSVICANGIALGVFPKSFTGCEISPVPFQESVTVFGVSLIRMNIHYQAATFPANYRWTAEF